MKTREVRRKVVIRARMRNGATWGDICIRNISSRGLMAQAATPPPAGTYIEVRRGRHIIVGRTVWSNGRNFGIRSQDRIDIDGVISETPAPANDSAMERRDRTARPAGPSVAAQAESSKRFAAAFQFLIMVGLGLAAAGFVASEVHQALSRPFASVEDALGGKRPG